MVKRASGLILLGGLISQSSVAAPLNPSDCTLSGASLELGSPITIDTSSSPPTMSGGATSMGTLQNGVAVFCFETVVLDRNVVVTGSWPVAILSRSTLSVSSITLDVAANGEVGGPGGQNGGESSPGFGAGGGGISGDEAGGGGFGGAGGGGGLGGTAYGDLLVMLEGGSGGGGPVDNPSADGGGGGGAIELGALGALTVASGATIDARGASATGSAGGGSGGAILLHGGAGSTFDGTADASGGNASGGGQDNGGGGGGRIVLLAIANTGTLTATGGTGTQGSGGSGSTSVVDPTPDIDLDGVPAPTDCNDLDPNIHPSATEVCDSLDNNCDGQIDEGGVCNPVDTDSDGDPDATDCMPNDPEVFTANPATVINDGKDNDCSTGGIGDECFEDLDLDGFGSTVEIDSTNPNCTGSGESVVSTDCDDGSDVSFPLNPEVCDGLDNDCNGPIDDGATDTVTYWEDADGDGFGMPPNTVIACSPPTGFADNDLDCDDGDNAVSPAGIEVCDGVDNDCSGDADEGLTVDLFPDGDADGLGAMVVAQAVCPGAPGFVADNTDCDDADNAVRQATTWFFDQDQDGFGSANMTSTCLAPPGFVSAGGDCDDFDDQAFPGGIEVCDGADNDCDGTTDQGAVGSPAWYPDADSDGHGSDSASAIDACSMPAGFVASNDDCDDDDATVFTGAIEACNGLDNDCDGTPDDGTGDQLWYIDGDGDGIGGVLGTTLDCAPPPGEVGVGGDCDDNNPAVRPGVQEVCDGIDNDCDGSIDLNAVDGILYFEDADDDGFGTSTSTVVACAPPTGFLAISGDCNDSSDQVAPGLLEVCDGLDNDCNGLLDDVAGPLIWWDVDGDGFGDQTLPALPGCLGPGFADNGLDCNDFVAEVFPADDGMPGGIEVCDLLDNDCDGMIDAADPDVVLTTFYPDLDQDGFGDDLGAEEACSPDSVSVTTPGDCDDTNPSIYPGATDVAGNGLDEDCDGEDAEPPDTDLPDPTADTGPRDGDTGPLARSPDLTSTGCGCSNGAMPSGALGLLLALLGRRRPA